MSGRREYNHVCEKAVCMVEPPISAILVAAPVVDDLVGILSHDPSPAGSDVVDASNTAYHVLLFLR